MTYQYFTLEDLKAKPQLIENHPLNARFRLSKLKFTNINRQDPSLKLLAQNQEQQTEIILLESLFGDRAHADKKGYYIDDEQRRYLLEHGKDTEMLSVDFFLYQGLFVWKQQFIVYFNVQLVRKIETIKKEDFVANFQLANTKACRLALIGRHDANGQVDFTVPSEYYYPALSMDEQESTSTEFSESILTILEDVKNAVEFIQKMIINQNYHRNDCNINLVMKLDTLTTAPEKNAYEPYSIKVEGYTQVEACSGELGLPIDNLMANSLSPIYYKGSIEVPCSGYKKTLVFQNKQKQWTFILYELPRFFSEKSIPNYSAFVIIARKYLVRLNLSGCHKVYFKEVAGKKIACFKLSLQHSAIYLLADIYYPLMTLGEYKFIDHFTRNQNHQPLEIYHVDEQYSSRNTALTILRPYLKDIMHDAKMLIEKLAPILASKETILNCFNQNKYENKLSLDALTYDALEIEVEDFEYFEPITDIIN